MLFGEPTVAFRGPWNRTDLVKIAPSATDLGNRYEHHLDYPGDPLDAGCDYELWSRRLTTGTKPTVYAHIATDPGYPDKLALQYWFFYPFNDFDNTHEGDWEMTQLVFDAANVDEALAKDPTEVGYSSHEGAERAAWGDEKLEIVDGTHPVVYPASGSHANKFTAALYLGNSASRSLRRGGRWVRSHARPASRGPSGREDDPERRKGSCGRLTVDRLRGPLGRAAARLLQRAD